MSKEIRKALRKLTCRGCHRGVNKGEVILAIDGCRENSYLCKSCIEEVVEEYEQTMPSMSN